jgi:RNase adaptor protein for sRNA GlmZ degradation
MCQLIILTGASGAGKTTLANAIAAKCGAAVKVLFFDSIGIPPVEEMIASFGSGEAWQRARTIDWMQKIASSTDCGCPVVFEGQMRISFIEEAIASSRLASTQIILVDCDDDTRRRRLSNERAQNRLVDPTMMTWAHYLRTEAESGGYEILDTSQLDVDACVKRVCRHIKVD